MSYLLHHIRNKEIDWQAKDDAQDLIESKWEVNLTESTQAAEPSPTTDPAQAPREAPFFAGSNVHDLVLLCCPKRTYSINSQELGTPDLVQQLLLLKLLVDFKLRMAGRKVLVIGSVCYILLYT